MSRTIKNSDDAANNADLGLEDFFKLTKLIIARIYGKNSNDLLTYLIENEYVAEEMLSQNINIKSNEGRRILQYLSDEAIVIPDKIRVGGNVLHVWRLNKSALASFVLKKLKKAREKLDLRMKFESKNTIYKCPKCKKIYILEDAFINDFYCHHDGSLLVEELDKDRHIKALTDAIEKLDYLIKKIEQLRY